jgi:hypothetical protein
LAKAAAAFGPSFSWTLSLVSFSRREIWQHFGSFGTLLRIRNRSKIDWEAKFDAIVRDIHPERWRDGFT